MTPYDGNENPLKKKENKKMGTNSKNINMNSSGNESVGQGPQYIVINGVTWGPLKKWPYT